MKEVTQTFPAEETLVPYPDGYFLDLTDITNPIVYSTWSWGAKPHKLNEINRQLTWNKDSFGYYQITLNNQIVLKHRLIYELTTKQKVSKGSQVYFIDGNKENFNPENLKCMTKNEYIESVKLRGIKWGRPMGSKTVNK